MAGDNVPCRAIDDSRASPDIRCRDCSCAHLPAIAARVRVFCHISTSTIERVEVLHPPRLARYHQGESAARCALYDIPMPLFDTRDAKVAMKGPTTIVEITAG